MKKIPCKDCLCFPVCKSQAVIENFEGGYVRLYILDNKCELFSEWYKSSECYDNADAEVLEYFGATSASWISGMVGGKWKKMKS
jgi:hypothetical protein